MKARRYWLVVVLAIGLFSDNIFAAGATWERELLAGLEGVVVVVEQIDEKAKMNGLTRESLGADTELKLRQNEIKVYSEQEQLLQPALPKLYINVNVVVREEIDFAAANIRVAFKQIVSLQRDPTRVYLATTWEASDILTCEKADLKDVRENVKILVDQFINDFRAANPLTTRPRRRGRDPVIPGRIETRVGGEFVIALRSNPSTGYEWRLEKPLPRMLKLINKRYIADKPQLYGSGGTEEWTF